MRINVTRSSMPPMEEYVEEIRSLWDSHWLTNNGEKLKKLEAALKERLDVPCAALFTNGHLALEALLKALGLKGEVITTPFTFASTTHAIVRAGLTPVFCDIREDDYTMDPAKVETLITPRTCAILPVHVYGNLCDDGALSAIAKKHGLKLIYDAAHAFHVSRDGVSAARMGDAIATKSRFFCADAGAAATRLAAEGLRPDVIVLDPPRKGCDEATLSAVVKMNPQRVVYVSCNPATAARDAKWLETQGYRTEKVQPVDLFPRTKHCECVLLMSKVQ